MIFKKIASLFAILHYNTLNENQKKKTLKSILRNPILSLFTCIVFLTAFTAAFLFGHQDFFGALWMIITPALAMYILNFAVAFWTCILYGIIVTLLTFIPETKVILLETYSPVFISRYFLIYWIDFSISTVAMFQLHLMRYNQNRKNELLKTAVLNERNKVSSISMQTIMAINSAVQAKDLYTGQHSQRVAHFSCLIAEKLGWSEAKIQELKTIALLHDIGKIGVPEEVLNKPGRLTEEEYTQMKMHTVTGGKILKDLTLIPNVDLGAKYHHERYDGRGYPEGLIGDAIPMEARIIGIADSFDAMNFSRIYRPRCDLDYVKSEITKGSGTQFDPTIAEAFYQVCEENGWFRDFNI